MRYLNIFLLGSVFFAYPFFLFFPSSHNSYLSFIQLTNSAFLALISISIIILLPEKVLSVFSQKLFLFCLSLIFLVCAIHFFLFDAYRFEHFMDNVFIIAFPLAIMLNAEFFKKHLAGFMTLFWLVDAVNFLYWRADIGIAGNVNWHASLILSATPFAVYFIYKHLFSRTGSMFFPILIPLLVVCQSLYMLARCHSRGAWLSIYTVILCCLILFFPNYRRKIVIGVSGLVVVLLGLFILRSDIFGDIIYNDVRVPLMNASVNLIEKHPWMGVGVQRFEGVFACFREINYFLRSDYYAVRSNHPHNQFLYFAASLGIPAFVAWLLLIFVPLWRIVSEIRKKDVVVILCIVSLLLILIHSMFDLVLFVWPTMFFFYLFLGIIWSEYYAAEKSAKMPLFSWYKHFKYAMISGCCLVLGFFIYNNVKYSMNIRDAFGTQVTGEAGLTVSYLDKALKYKKDPVEACRGGLVSLLAENDSYLAMKFLRKMEDCPTSSVGHSNSYLAACLLKRGRKVEALEYLNREVKYFPISVVALYNKMRLENELNLVSDAEKTAGQLVMALKFKNFEMSDIPELCANPHYDDRFHEFKLKGRDKVQ